MPEYTTPVIGRFCWIECLTTSPAAAREFYGGLFGWKTEERSLAPDGPPYGMFQIGKASVGGLLELPEMARQAGAPPHWLTYIYSEDVAATAARAVELGAAILMGPMKTGPGTMAVLRDPTGAAFALWHSDEPMGTWLFGEHGALCWTELMTRDVEGAKAFYCQLFGWTTDGFPGMEGYTLFKQGEETVGGLMDMPQEAGDMPPCWSIYLSAPSLDATMEKAKALGGTLATGAMDVPGVGRFAFLCDPQGAAFGVLEPAPQAATPA